MYNSKSNIYLSKSKIADLKECEKYSLRVKNTLYPLTLLVTRYYAPLLSGSLARFWPEALPRPTSYRPTCLRIRPLFDNDKVMREMHLNFLLSHMGRGSGSF